MVTLEFQVIDHGSRAPIETSSIEITYAYRPSHDPIRSTKDDAGIRRLSYVSRYVQDEAPHSESYFLDDLWLDVTAPGYEPVKVSLLKFVGKQRAIDRVPWVSSPPLIVTLRKGQPKTPQLGFIAGQYRGEHHGFVLDLCGDGTFAICWQLAHSCNPVGFGVAEIVDGKLKLQFESSHAPADDDPRMKRMLAQVDSRIKAHALSRL